MAGVVRGGGADAEDIGLALYQTLRTNGSIAPEKAAAGIGLTEAEARAGWAELDELGLIRPGRVPEEVDSVEPDTALIGLLARQREALRAQRDELSAIVRAAESLMERYRPAVLRDAAEIEVELLIGDNRKRQSIGDFNARITESTGSMHPGPLPPAEVLVHSLAADSALIERGIKVRAVYGQSINSAPRQRKYLTELSATGVEVRLAPQVPFDLLIADSHSALVSANPDNPSGPAVIVRGAALVRSYLALYEDCWLRAVPYSAKSAGTFEADGELTEQHRTTMRLLANGLTDERIARKLGVSLRTVSRLVSEIMRYLQADSRFQAGVLAAAHGLI
ncbi:regulatory protein, luxR family [Actinacidiphila alni]|uniref:Regulatory protein, luxR family n=1 Tax=Actinacidiphila alni TaxID=380248 RepID=A0A1I2I2P5_9ACTN|nr:LuxR C-terminal-related transcriptional regulator [Actinacidiphila alni]SFF35910.1 regulatory protein, luxR family [Actinacidiphila alni]